MTPSTATLRSFEIGGFVLKGVPAMFSRAEGGAFDTRRQAGNLGAGILSRFCVLFDYAHETLWLEPGADWDRAPFRKDRTGLSVRLAGTPSVLFVSPGSPAESRLEGRRADAAIDSRPVDRKLYWDQMADWNAAPAGTEVALTLPGGEVRRLKLEDYY
jgi:hypothetical protein